MNYKVIPVDKFKKEAKKLIKKYPSLKNELAELAGSLSAEPTKGTPLGNDTYKIRVSIQSKGKGRSGGGRIITYVITPQKEVYLLTIFDKSDFDSIDDKTIRRIIALIPTKR